MKMIIKEMMRVPERHREREISMCLCVKSDDGSRKKGKPANKRHWGKEKEK